MKKPRRVGPERAAAPEKEKLMRDFEREFARRTAFIRNLVDSSHAAGIVYGNSGGKDCTLVSILCKAACDNTVGLILPCASKQNYGSDASDARAAAEQFGIETRVVDLTKVRGALLEALGGAAELTDAAVANLAPWLRMTALYAVAGSENRLVAGTGNRSERYTGYFTKWGDGACDFNPIADLTATEVFAFLEYLHAPESIIRKAPSAGLFEGQTDEKEMGVTYRSIDAYLAGEAVPEADRAVIARLHGRSLHKLNPVPLYSDDPE